MTDKNLKQAGVGRLLGMNQQNAGFFVNNDIKDVPSSRIAFACKELGLDPMYFFDRVPRGAGRYTDYLKTGPGGNHDDEFQEPSSYERLTGKRVG